MALNLAKFTLRFDLCGIPGVTAETNPIEGFVDSGVNYNYEHVSRVNTTDDSALFGVIREIFG